MQSGEMERKGIIIIKLMDRMKIYIERRIESEKDLPKEDGKYLVHKTGDINPCYYFGSIWQGYIYKDAWLTYYDHWLEPIEVSDEGAEEILRDTFNSSFLDLDYLELYVKAMQEYAAIQVAKALDKPANKDIESWAKNIYPDYYPNPKNVHEMNVRTKQRNLQSLLIQGAKAALNGEIKKEQ